MSAQQMFPWLTNLQCSAHAMLLAFVIPIGGVVCSALGWLIGSAFSRLAALAILVISIWGFYEGYQSAVTACHF